MIATLRDVIANTDPYHAQFAPLLEYIDTLAQQRDAAVGERDFWILRAHERNDEVRTLRARLAACERDAARLDWLGKQMDGVHVEAGFAGGEYQMRRFATVFTFTNTFRADTVREAIDKAMDTARTLSTPPQDAATTRGEG